MIDRLTGNAAGTSFFGVGFLVEARTSTGFLVVGGVGGRDTFAGFKAP